MNKASKKNVNPLRKSYIITKIILLTQNEVKADPLVVNWIEEILVSKKFKFLSKLFTDIFDICAVKEKIFRAFKVLKILLKIDKDDTIENLKELNDFPNRLISYIKESENKDICEDAFYVLYQLIKANAFKDLQYQISVSFIEALFQSIENVNDEENFKALVRIMIEINNIYQDVESNLFLKVYHRSDNSRVFVEVLIRLINEEHNKGELEKMFFTFSSILEKEKSNVLYNSDIDTYIDIILSLLTSFYTQEIKTFIIDSFQKFTLYVPYEKNGYKREEIVDLFKDFADNDTESEVIRQKSIEVLKNMNEYEDEDNSLCR